MSVFPHPPLMPVDPVSRATNRQLAFRIMKDLYGLIIELETGKEAAKNNARKVMRDHLTAIAPAFESFEFFMSDDFSLVDCSLAPILWRLENYGVNLPHRQNHYRNMQKNSSNVKVFRPVYLKQSESFHSNIIGFSRMDFYRWI